MTDEIYVQNEIYNFLRTRRLLGEERYWRKFEIHNALVKSGKISCNSGKCLTGRKVNKLFAHGFLDIKQESNKFWEQSYRIKDKYLKLEDPAEVSPFFQEEVKKQELKE